MSKASTQTKEEVIYRIAEIESIQKSLPKVKAGDPLQAIKWSLACEKRRLRIRLSRLNGKHHTRSQAIQFINSKNGKCELCSDASSPSIDHIIPISKGGSDSLENIRVLCIRCNSKKGNKWQAS